MVGVMGNIQYQLNRAQVIINIMQKYEKMAVIGEGAYGVVWKCRHTDTKEIVAIKKFKDSEDNDCNVKKTTTREIKILRMLDHQNIVRLKQALRKKGIIYLVFEHLECNLLEMIQKEPGGLDPQRVKQITYQILRGIAHVHSMNIVHRDIKPENILIGDGSINKTSVKICDFGFAKELLGQDELTDYVATRWYRSPELLVGESYNKPVDVWAVGCLLGELVDGNPLFPGADDFDQLYLIQKTLGPVSQDQHECFIKNEKYVGKKIPEIDGHDSLEKRYFGRVSTKGLDLMKKLLKVIPEERITAIQAMKHSYFDSIREDSSKKYSHEARVISACEINYHEGRKRQFTGYVNDDDREATIHSIYAAKTSKSQIKRKEEGTYNSTYLRMASKETPSQSVGRNAGKSKDYPAILKHNRGSSKTQMDFYPEITENKKPQQPPTKTSINKIYGSNQVKQTLRFRSNSKKNVQQLDHESNSTRSFNPNHIPLILFGGSQRRKSKSRESKDYRGNINIVINNNMWMEPSSIVINK